MKTLACVLLLCSSAAFAGNYGYVYPHYSIRSNGPASGTYTVDIAMHNNAGSTADCTFEVGGQSQSVTVNGYGDASLVFPNVSANPENVRYGCDAR